MRVWLSRQGWEFEADGATSLLAAAQRAGIRLPSSCRNGTCRTCLCRLDSGSVRYLAAWPGVTPDERREGWVLPCVAVAETDLVITGTATKI